MTDSQNTVEYISFQRY